MTPDTTFVAPVTQVLTNPAFIQLLAGAIIAGLTFIFGLLKIPKSIATKLVQYGAIIVIAIIDTENKAKTAEARNTKLYDSAEKLGMASEFVAKAIETSPNRNIFGKITKTLGGVANVVNIAFPIIKPFLKKG